jgi:hypothetical protein
MMVLATRKNIFQESFDQIEDKDLVAHFENF